MKLKVYSLENQLPVYKISLITCPYCNQEFYPNRFDKCPHCKKIVETKAQP